MPAPLTENRSAGVAHVVAAGLRGLGWRVDKPQDLGSSARLVVRAGSRRDPGDDPSVVDTERTFVVSVSEMPAGQAP